MPGCTIIGDEFSNGAEAEPADQQRKFIQRGAAFRKISLLAVSLEDASRKDIVEMLFAMRDSRDAARSFLRWLREGGARRTGMGNRILKYV